MRLEAIRVRFYQPPTLPTLEVLKDSGTAKKRFVQTYSRKSGDVPSAANEMAVAMIVINGILRIFMVECA
jgi:hypothetical protein